MANNQQGGSGHSSNDRDMDKGKKTDANQGRQQSQTDDAKNRQQGGNAANDRQKAPDAGHKGGQR